MTPPISKYGLVQLNAISLENVEAIYGSAPCFFNWKCFSYLQLLQELIPKAMIISFRSFYALTRYKTTTKYGGKMEFDNKDEFILLAFGSWCTPYFNKGMPLSNNIMIMQTIIIKCMQVIKYLNSSKSWELLSCHRTLVLGLQWRRT